MTKLQFISPLSPELEKRLRRIIRRIDFKKGDEILKPGEVCTRIFFIKTGLIRIYHELGEKEITDWFLKEGDFCISVGSFFRQVESREYHVALEDCECWGISFEELENTYALYPKFNVHGRILSNTYYMELDYRTSRSKGKGAGEKYEDLISKNEDFIDRISISDMASYLGIGDSTFKAMRAQYIKKKALDARWKKRITG